MGISQHPADNDCPPVYTCIDGRQPSCGGISSSTMGTQKSLRIKCLPSIGLSASDALGPWVGLVFLSSNRTQHHLLPSSFINKVCHQRLFSTVARPRPYGPGLVTLPRFCHGTGATGRGSSFVEGNGISGEMWMSAASTGEWLGRAKRSNGKDGATIRGGGGEQKSF